MPDVLIAGGGPAGLAAALALAERGLTVTVVDPLGGVAPARDELLAHGAGAIMHRLGLGPALDSAVTVRDIQSHWGAAGLQSHGAMPGLGWHGWGVDRSTLSAAMIRRATGSAVQIDTASVRSAQRRADMWDVQLSDGSRRDSRFVVDATGRAAQFARRNGAVARHGPDLVAAVWRVSADTDPIMQAEAAPDGWWYAVPGHQAATVAFVGKAASAKAASASPKTFLRSSKARLAGLAVHASVPPRLMDSRSAVLDRACGPGWLATGDAACAFDPISSQGLFNALSSGFFAGQAAADALAGDADAPLVFEALVKRTAEHTHARTHLQYAALPFDTPFWRHQARGGHEKVARHAFPA